MTDRQKAIAAYNRRVSKALRSMREARQIATEQVWLGAQEASLESEQSLLSAFRAGS